MHIEVLVVKKKKKKKKKEREVDKKIKVLKRKREERIKCFHAGALQANKRTIIPIFLCLK
jgi:hypothetical protein